MNLAALMKKFGTEQGLKDFIEGLLRSEYKHARFKVGKYTGDAAATKAITGIGFTPTVLVIYNQVTNKALCIKTSQDTTSCFIITNAAGTLYVTDVVISLDADGFTVGDGSGSANYANEATSYAYVAFG